MLDFHLASQNRCPEFSMDCLIRLRLHRLLIMMDMMVSTCSQWPSGIAPTSGSKKESLIHSCQIWLVYGSLNSYHIYWLHGLLVMMVLMISTCPERLCGCLVKKERKLLTVALCYSGEMTRGLTSLHMVSRFLFFFPSELKIVPCSHMDLPVGLHSCHYVKVLFLQLKLIKHWWSRSHGSSIIARLIH